MVSGTGFTAGPSVAGSPRSLSSNREGAGVDSQAPVTLDASGDAKWRPHTTLDLMDTDTTKETEKLESGITDTQESRPEVSTINVHPNKTDGTRKPILEKEDRLWANLLKHFRVIADIATKSQNCHRNVKEASSAIAPILAQLETYRARFREEFGKEDGSHKRKEREEKSPSPKPKKLLFPDRTQLGSTPPYRKKELSVAISQKKPAHQEQDTHASYLDPTTLAVKDMKECLLSHDKGLNSMFSYTEKLQDIIKRKTRSQDISDALEELSGASNEVRQNIPSLHSAAKTLIKSIRKGDPGHWVPPIPTSTKGVQTTMTDYHKREDSFDKEDFNHMKQMMGSFKDLVIETREALTEQHQKLIEWNSNHLVQQPPCQQPCTDKPSRKETNKDDFKADPNVRRKKTTESDLALDIEASTSQTVKKTPRARPDALIISTSESRSYRDILKSLRHSKKSTELGENIKTIKKSRTGDVVMTVTRKAGQCTDTLIKEIGEVLGDNSSVRQLGNNKLVQINNLDGVTSKEEVAEAIQNALGTDAKLDRLIVRNLHTWSNGTQTAHVLIPEPEALRLLKKGKIKVGWLFCPVRIKEKPVRCYRCHGFDHRKANCPGQDNSKCCWRCGSDTHQLKECNNIDVPKCFHCIRLDDKGDTSHFSGSKTCRALRGTDSYKKLDAKEQPLNGEAHNAK